MKKVAIAGLGAMGKGMAANLLRAGFPTTVFDVRSEPVAQLVALGATAAATVREAAWDADVFIVMVANYPQAEQVVFGQEGAVEGLREGSTAVLMSTVAPEQAKAMGNGLAKRGIRFLDAAVSGGSVGAEAGTLTIMVGGPAEVLEDSREVLRAVGRNIFHVGESHGMGEGAKIAHNLVAGVSLVALAEGLVLAGKLGIDARTMLDIIVHGAADCWMARQVAPRMLERRFDDPSAQLALFVKDLGLAVRAGNEVTLPLPVATAAYQMMQMGAAAGMGAEDDSAVVKVYEQIAGLQIGGANDATAD